MRREDGKQCQAARLRQSDYCLFHHPWTQRHRKELESIEELPLRRSSKLHALLVKALEGVEEGRLNPQQAYALGWLVRLLRENLPELEQEREYYKKEADVEGGEPEFGEPDSGKPDPGEPDSGKPEGGQPAGEESHGPGEKPGAEQEAELGRERAR